MRYNGPMGIARFIAAASKQDAKLAPLTPEAGIALCLELCELTDAIIDGRPNAEALRQPHPRSAEALALWQRLMKAARDG